MVTDPPRECCPRFDPAPWDEKLLIWGGRRFVKDRVSSIFHIPLNFGAVMTRNLTAIEAAGALSPSRLTLCDENSLWGADLYIEVSREVPARQLVEISGTFLSKVFEGSFSEIRRWTAEMKDYAKKEKKKIRRLYFFYTTCPKCAKLYGKNFVVLVAQV